MAIATSSGLVHLPFGERPQYGQPYPEGQAVGFISQDGDATGGSISMTMLADGGFLYRLELLQLVIGQAADRVVFAITSHRWATDKSGLGATAFDLDWGMPGHLVGSFAVHSMAAQEDGFDVMNQIKRFPLGRLDDVSLQTILNVTNTVNVDSITNELRVVCSYWSKQATYLPGFLSSFYEAPAVPPLIRSPI